MADSSVRIRIEAIDDTQAGIESARSGLSGLGKVALGIVGGGLAVAGAAAAGLTAGLIDCTRAAMDAEGVQTQLNAVLSSTGSVTGVTAEMVNQLADHFMGLTQFEDEAIISGETVLARFREIGADVFPLATDSMLDLAQAMGVDLNTAATTLGKALATPGEGLLRLKAAGVVFTDQEREMLQAMVDSGNIAEAQRMILDRLQSSIGNVAEAAGSTATGRMIILSNQIGNLKETIGTALLPVLTQVGGALVSALQKPEIQAAISQLAATLGDFVSRVLPPLIEFLTGTLIPGLTTLAGLLSGNVNPAATGLSSAFSRISVILAPITNQLGPLIEALRSLWQTIAPILIPALQKLGDIVLNVIIPILGQQFMTTIQAIIGVISGLVQFLTGAINIIVGLFTGDLDKARLGAQQVTDGIRTIFESLGTALLETVKNIVDGIIGTFKQCGVDIVRPVQDIVDNVVNIITGTDWIKVAKGIIDGLVQGIKDNASKVGDAIKSTVKGAVDSVLGFLGIQSPSRLFQWIGQQMAAGLALGIQRSRSQVTGEMKSLLKDLFLAWEYNFRHLLTYGDRTSKDLKERFTKYIQEAVITPGMTLGDVAMQVYQRLMQRMLTADSFLRRNVGKAMREYQSMFEQLVRSFGLGKVTPFTHMQLAEMMLELASGVQRFGSAISSRYEERVLKPMQEQLRILEEQGTQLEQIARLKQAIAAAEERISAFQRQQQDLQFLQAQLEFVKMIKENGLNARQILGGLKLGLQADLPALLEAMTAAMQQLIGAAERELQIASPSRVFQQIGQNIMSALSTGVLRAVPAAAGITAGAMGQTVYNTYYLTAHYRYESPTGLAQRVRMLQMMAR